MNKAEHYNMKAATATAPRARTVPAVLMSCRDAAESMSSPEEKPEEGLDELELSEESPSPECGPGAGKAGLSSPEGGRVGREGSVGSEGVPIDDEVFLGLLLEGV